MISIFCFGVLVGSFGALCVWRLLFLGLESYFGHFWDAILGELTGPVCCEDEFLGWVPAWSLEPAWPCHYP